MELRRFRDCTAADAVLGTTASRRRLLPVTGRGPYLLAARAPALRERQERAVTEGLRHVLLDATIISSDRSKSTFRVDAPDRTPISDVTAEH